MNSSTIPRILARTLWKPIKTFRRSWLDELVGPWHSDHIMPEQVLLFRVFVGAPSDVDEAHDVIRGQIEQWNRDHGPLAGARVELTNWRTHSHRAAGLRPQAILNKQVVDQCDIMVGIFNARFGSPTGVADSGTEEEIRRSIKRGKKVMVYFANLARPKRNKARGEFERIEKFKGKLGQNAIYHTYTDMPAFEEAFRQHLAGVMNELLAKMKTGLK